MSVISAGPPLQSWRPAGERGNYNEVLSIDPVQYIAALKPGFFDLQFAGLHKREPAVRKIYHKHSEGVFQAELNPFQVRLNESKQQDANNIEQQIYLVLSIKSGSINFGSNSADVAGWDLVFPVPLANVKLVVGDYSPEALLHALGNACASEFDTSRSTFGVDSANNKLTYAAWTRTSTGTLLQTTLRSFWPSWIAANINRGGTKLGHKFEWKSPRPEASGTTKIRLGPDRASQTDYVLHYEEGGPKNPEGHVDPEPVGRIGWQMEQEKGSQAFMAMWRTGLRSKFKAFVDALSIKHQISSSVDQIDVAFAPHDHYKVVASYDGNYESDESLECSRFVLFSPEDNWVTDPDFVGWAQRSRILGTFNYSATFRRWSCEIEFYYNIDICFGAYYYEAKKLADASTDDVSVRGSNIARLPNAGRWKLKRNGESFDLTFLGDSGLYPSAEVEQRDNYTTIVPDRSKNPGRQKLLEEFKQKILDRFQETVAGWREMMPKRERPTLELWSKGLARTPNLRLLPYTEGVEFWPLAWAEIQESSTTIEATIIVEEAPAPPPAPVPEPAPEPVPSPEPAPTPPPDPVTEITTLRPKREGKLYWTLRTGNHLPRPQQDCSLQLTGKNSKTDDINFDYIHIQFPLSSDGLTGLLDAGPDNDVVKAVQTKVSTTEQQALLVKTQLVNKDDEKFCSLEIVRDGSHDDDKKRFFTLAVGETVTLVINGRGGMVGKHDVGLSENIVDSVGEFQELKDTSIEVAVLKA